MVFETWSEFFQMGRHGVYVWSAYGLSVLVILAVVFVSLWRFKQWKNQIERQKARSQRLNVQSKLQKSSGIGDVSPSGGEENDASHSS